MPQDHAAHQVEGLRRDPKTERRKARGEARHPQHAHRILDEGVGHMLCDRIYGEVAAREVLLQRHLGTELDREAAVAGRHLALEPGERVFLVSFGMQKHRKVAAHLAVIHALERVARAADHDPVAFLDRKPEQGVSNCSADQIHLHR